MKLTTTLAIVFCCFLPIVNCQWVIHNNTLVVNSTVIQRPNYGPGVQGLDGNSSLYNSFNQTTVGRRFGNDLIVGRPGPYDRLLFQQWYYKIGKFLQIRETIIVYPTNPWGCQCLITAIGIFDQSLFSGGHAAIIAGGVGHRTATIRLYSERGRGFNFKVVIYGR